MKLIKLIGTWQSAQVSDEDFSYLDNFTWGIDAQGYPRTRMGSETIIMHRLLLGHLDGHEVDHKDQDKLNNQRDNLRQFTPSQNKQNGPIKITNTSGYKGVSLNKKTGKWEAGIFRKYKKYNLGLFLTREEAALAYNKKAIELFGPEAYQNKIA